MYIHFYYMFKKANEMDDEYKKKNKKIKYTKIKNHENISVELELPSIPSLFDEENINDNIYRKDITEIKNWNNEMVKNWCRYDVNIPTSILQNIKIIGLHLLYYNDKELKQELFGIDDKYIDKIIIERNINKWYIPYNSKLLYHDIFDPTSLKYI